jgi:sensor histidine kinase YesM
MLLNFDGVNYKMKNISVKKLLNGRPFNSFFLIISLFASLIFFRVIRITSKSYHQPFNSFFLIISLFASLILFRAKKKLLNG